MKISNKDAVHPDLMMKPHFKPDSYMNLFSLHI